MDRSFAVAGKHTDQGARDYLRADVYRFVPDVQPDGSWLVLDTSDESIVCLASSEDDAIGVAVELISQERT